MAIPLARVTVAGSGFLIAGGVMLAVVALRQQDEPTQAPLVAPTSTKTADAIASAASWSGVPDPHLAPPPVVPKVEEAKLEEPAPIEVPPMAMAPCPPPVVPAAPVPPPVIASSRPRVDGSGGVGWVRISMRCWGWASAEGTRVETTGGKLTLAPGKHVVTITMGPECAQPQQTRIRSVVVKSNTTTLVRLEDDD